MTNTRCRVHCKNDRSSVRSNAQCTSPDCREILWHATIFVSNCISRGLQGPMFTDHRQPCGSHTHRRDFVRVSVYCTSFARVRSLPCAQAAVNRGSRQFVSLHHPVRADACPQVILNRNRNPTLPDHRRGGGT